MSNDPGIVADAARQLIEADNTIEALRRELETVRAKNDDMQARWSSGEASDGYHTHNELYEYRMLYNAALFNTWSEYQHCADPHGAWPDFPRVVKSWKHSDGEPCFGGGWFIVVASLPTGQISNHYRAEHWDLFRIPEKTIPPKYDGHTAEQAAQRLRDYLEQI